jgi:spermidine/putrescine transport system substrate-binding protein
MEGECKPALALSGHMEASPQRYDRRGVLAAGAALAVSAYGARPAFARPELSGTLHYYNWIDYVNPETYAAFTKATKIKVRKSYFVSNEALWTRLKTGGRGYDLAAPTGYMVARLAEDGLLTKINWKKLPTVRKNIDPKFLGLPYDPKNEWSVPKDWGTTGFMYRTDKITQRPVSWAQFFSLFKKYPRKFTILDGSAEVVGSVAAMMGYSYNTDSHRELAKITAFLLDLKPYIHSIDSVGYKDAITTGKAYGGLGWNGDGAYVIAHSPNNAADYVVAKEGGEFWVDAHVIPKGATNPEAAHAWIDFVYQPKRNAAETLYTYFGSPLRRQLLTGVLAKTILADTDVFPSAGTMKHLEPNAVSPAGVRARERIWAELKAGR